MGNKISRRRDTVKSVETAATAEDPAAAQATEEPEVPQTQEATEEENLDVVVGEPLIEDACLPSEECTSEMKQPKGPAATPATENDAEPKPVPTESPAPIQPEPLVSVEEPPPKSELVEEPKAVVAAQLAPEPEPVSNLQTEAEVVAEPISEPVPGPAEQQTDVLTQETLPKPVISSSTLVSLGVPDVTPIHNPVNADKPLDIPLTEDQDGARAAEISTSEPEKPGETSDSLKEPVEAAENLLVSDVNEDSVSTLLKNLELQGNDLVTDLIPSDVKMPDETPSADVCSSTELM